MDFLGSYEVKISMFKYVVLLVPLKSPPTYVCSSDEQRGLGFGVKRVFYSPDQFSAPAAVTYLLHCVITAFKLCCQPSHLSFSPLSVTEVTSNGFSSSSQTPVWVTRGKKNYGAENRL